MRRHSQGRKAPIREPKIVSGVWCARAGAACLCWVCCAPRWGRITRSIMLPAARMRPAWAIAAHRLAEVSIGCIVGLVVTAVWAERETAPVPKRMIRL